MARREGFDDSLRSLVESALAETLTEVRFGSTGQRNIVI
jgi:hypothetical protein